MIFLVAHRPTGLRVPNVTVVSTKPPAYTPMTVLVVHQTCLEIYSVIFYKERPYVVTVKSKRLVIVNQSNKKLLIKAQMFALFSFFNM
jgi:hypothetical protein